MAVMGMAQLAWFATSLGIMFPNGVGVTIRMSNGSAVPQKLAQLSGNQVSTDDVKALVGSLNSSTFVDSLFMVTSEIGHHGPLFQVHVLSHHTTVCR
jgi:hypothetical protein